MLVSPKEPPPILSPLPTLHTPSAPTMKFSPGSGRHVLSHLWASAAGIPLPVTPSSRCSPTPSHLPCLNTDSLSPDTLPGVLSPSRYSSCTTYAAQESTSPPASVHYLVPYPNQCPSVSADGPCQSTGPATGPSTAPGTEQLLGKCLLYECINGCFLKTSRAGLLLHCDRNHNSKPLKDPFKEQFYKGFSAQTTYYTGAIQTKQFVFLPIKVACPPK